MLTENFYFYRDDFINLYVISTSSFDSLKELNLLCIDMEKVIKSRKERSEEGDLISVSGTLEVLPKQ